MQKKTSTPKKTALPDKAKYFKLSKLTQIFLSRMSKVINRFASFQDADDVEKMAGDAKTAQKKQAAAKETAKKVVVKEPTRQKRSGDNQEGFEQVAERPKTDGAMRGGRGGRGRGDGERGGRGRGGDGERRGGDRDGERRGGRGGDRVEGERRGGRGRGDGERGGRGRGRGAPRTNEDGTVDKAEAGGRPRRERFEGKAREDAHPMDRKDGTGRGRRGDRKEGGGRGGWGGKPRGEDATEETKGAAGEEETKERAPRERREPEPVVEEEEVGFTLDDYFAQKQASTKGMLASAGGRKHEKISEKVQGREGDKVMIKEGHNDLSWRDTHSVRPDVNANLLGFQSRDEDDFEARGRGRGGRGGRDQGPREARQGGNRRRGGKLAVNDDDFPTL